MRQFLAAGERSADAADAEIFVQGGKTKTGESIMITETAMTGPQLVTFCWLIKLDRAFCWLIKLDRAMCCSRLRPAGAGEYMPTLSVVVG